MVVGLVCALTGAQPVYAASEYDDIIHNSSTAKVYYNESDAVDISSNFESKVTELCNSTASASLSRAIHDGGHYAVLNLQVSQGSSQPNYQVVDIIWSEFESPGTTIWQFGALYPTNPDRGIRLQNPSGSGMSCYDFGPGGPGEPIASRGQTNGVWTYQAYFANYDVEYPEGYAGETLGTIADQPSVKPDYNDIVTLSFSVENKVIYYWDTTIWGDADKSKIVCRYTFAKEGGNVLSDTMGPCDGEVKTVTVDSYGTYAVRMDIVYDSNHDGFLNPEDPEEIVGSVGRELKVDGQTYSGTSGSTWNSDNRFEPSSCFQDFFPWVNLVGCGEVMGQAVQLLSFNTIKLNNEYDTGNNCVALSTLGSWIFAPNATVCPQIPATIRNIVTPFITLALAMGLIRFIVNHRAEDIG